MPINNFPSSGFVENLTEDQMCILYDYLVVKMQYKTKTSRSSLGNFSKMAWYYSGNFAIIIDASTQTRYTFNMLFPEYDKPKNLPEKWCICATQEMINFIKKNRVALDLNTKLYNFDVYNKYYHFTGNIVEGNTEITKTPKVGYKIMCISELENYIPNYKPKKDMAAICTSQKDVQFPESGKIKCTRSEEVRLILSVLFNEGFVWYSAGDQEYKCLDSKIVYWDSKKITVGTFDETYKASNKPEYNIEFFNNYKPKINNHELQREVTTNTGTERSNCIGIYRGVGKVTSSERLVGNKIPFRKPKGSIRSSLLCGTILSC